MNPPANTDSFGLRQAADVCSGGDQTAALEVIDRLASKSLVAAEPAEGRTRYRLLETVRQYAAGRLAEAGQADQGRQRHALAYLDLAERERDLTALSRDHDNFRAALERSLSAGGQAGPRLAHALGHFWLARGLLQEGRDWLERALAQRPADEHLRAGLPRLLGTVLFEAGDTERAEAVLTEGSQVAAAAGLAAVGARIAILLADIHSQQGRDSTSEALAECEAAIAILESEGDLEGLAEAWIFAGRLHYYRFESPADQEALERAMAYARQSGNRRAEFEAGGWLVGTFHDLTVPADVAVDRAEKLLDAARGEPWAEARLLKPLSPLYAYAGRFGDARTAYARSRAMLTGFGAKFAAAEGAMLAGLMELTAGDPAAAEHHAREGYEAFRAMGHLPYFSTTAGVLAEALYAQGRLDEAQRVTEEAQAAAPPDDIDAQARWRAVRAKLLARGGQFAAARALADEAEALISPTPGIVLHAEMLVAQAEVNRLAGAREQAAAGLRAALRFYEDARALPQTERARAALASLAAHPGREPA